MKLYDGKEREKKEAEELEKERMKKTNIIAQKMLSTFANNNRLKKSFLFSVGLRSVPTAFPDYLYFLFFNASAKEIFEARKQHFQNFFDQLLKLYAEGLKEVYNKENTLKDGRYEDPKSDSFSGEEIRNFFFIKRKYKEEKEFVERNFWSLHDALKYIGFDVWGEKGDGFGHRAYLCLKKSYDF